MLVDKYIPNLIAKPFDVSHEYAQVIYDQTSSPKLDKVFKKWEEDKWDILTRPGIGFVKIVLLV
jgi:fatty acid synthase subunit alpha, fungi type